jgi:hypothetical protein
MSEQTYKYAYNTYPIFSQELGHEGSFKRFTHFPTPKEVYEEALMGLPKFFPLTREPITVDMAEKYLTSAVAHIEMKLSCNLSQTIHHHSEDIIDGMFTNNYTGIKLTQWPATEIVQMQYKLAHTNTTIPFQTYTIPASWLYLRRNNLNVVAGVGSGTIQSNNAGFANTAGIFTYLTGIARGAYQPGVIEVVYKAGFDHDKLPANVADLIRTTAIKFFLADLYPAMFPTSGVNVSIDAVSQGVSFNIAVLLQNRLQMIEKKLAELEAAFKSGFGQTIKLTRFGS